MMQAYLSEYIASYGYLTIFFIVLLLELGLPGFPNELVLLYFGYISRKLSLSYPIVICLVILADTIGSFVLYLIFYYFKNFLVSIKPNWLKLPEQKMRQRS